VLRAASYALLVSSLLTTSLEAQRGSGGFRSPAGWHAYSAQSAHRSGFYPYFLPDDESYWFEGPKPEPLQRILYSPPEPDRTPNDAQVIEIPLTPGTKEAEPPPPAIFVLTSGKRLEARRFLLTATSLSVDINRGQRVIPLDTLDFDATVIANRQRGIILRIPADHNEICLSF
jgi:hypothetical protein